MANATITAKLVEKVLALDYASLPPAAIDMAKAVTPDGLGVMLAGADEPLGVGRISIEYVREMGGAPQSSVIAGGFKTSMPNAAYANGTMAHARDSLLEPSSLGTTTSVISAPSKSRADCALSSRSPATRRPFLGTEPVVNDCLIQSCKA